jgi:tetratricopeptide (TPR) repeat protein
VTRNPTLLAAACLLLAAAAFFPTLRNGFTTWDDPQYILENPLVRSVSPGSVVGMFTTPEYAGNYHPVTLLAIAAQYAAFGESPAGYHVVSLLLHLVATLLVFRLGLSLLRSPPAAFAAAALFGVHPLHLEPVGWIADQKDLLYVVFYLGAVLAYIGYRGSGESRRLYARVVPLFALSLLSKGVAVTLPVVLLLVDLHRDRKVTGASLREKAPLFALSVIFGILAINAQSAAGAMATAAIDTPVGKLLYASKGYVLYVVKTFVPFSISPWYPYPLEVPASYWAFPAIAAALLAAAFVNRRKMPLLLFGVGWYTVTVAPLLQLLQVGNAEMADRYSYLPSVGILMIAGWGLARITERSSGMNVKHLPAAIAGAYIVALAAFSFTLSPVWRDGVSLWSRVIEKYPDSPKGWYNRGWAYHTTRRFAEAVADYDRVIAMDPRYPFASSNRGLSYYFLGEPAKAIRDFDREIRSRPDDPDIRFWRGNVLAALGRYDEAIADLTAVLAAKPGNIEAATRRGLVYTAARDFPKAEADFTAAIGASPDDPDLYFDRANVRAGMRRWKDAIADYTSVLGINPANRDALYARGITAFMGADTAAACEDLRRASALGSAPADTAIADICPR